MIVKPQVKEVLQQLGNTPYGAALREYLLQAIAEIKDISTAKSWEETQGRQFALTLLKDLLSVMDKTNPTGKDKVLYS